MNKQVNGSGRWVSARHRSVGRDLSQRLVDDLERELSDVDQAFRYARSHRSQRNCREDRLEVAAALQAMRRYREVAK